MKISKQVSREVDILTEIAELQMKLVQKLGKRADLKLHEELLSDPSNNCLKITKEKVVKSIKDEIYKKKTDHGNSADVISLGSEMISFLLSLTVKLYARIMN